MEKNAALQNQAPSNPRGDRPRYPTIELSEDDIIEARRVSPPPLKRSQHHR